MLSSTLSCSLSFFPISIAENFRTLLRPFIVSRTHQPLLIIRDLFWVLGALVWFAVGAVVWLVLSLMRVLGKVLICSWLALRWTTRPRHALGSLLMLTLLCSSTPAAPQTIVTLAKESSVSFAFWYHAGGLAKLFQGTGVNAGPQEKQADRDAKVSRIQIFPDNVTIDLSDHVRFAAVAYDRDGNPVGGVKIKWSAQSLVPGQRIRLTPQGELEGIVPGSYTITAVAANKTAQVTVVVRSGVKRDLNLVPTSTRQVSSRDLPAIRIGSARETKDSKSSAAPSSKSRNRRSGSIGLARRAHTVAALPDPMPQGGGGGWNSTNYWSADDPGNGVGNPPGVAMDGGAGSGNFQFAAPIYSAAGRGINISLAASYNGRLWNKAGTQISYDNDRGWPAPGFNLGFGKLLGMGVYNGCMLVDADGTRHSYTGSITIYNWGTHGVLHTTDGSFIDYAYWSGTGGVITWAQARLANGTVINYGANGPGGVYPISIEDANGNYISITYVNNSGPRIQTVTDTMGRLINFSYDSNNLLTAITAPGLSGGTRTLVRFHYHQLALNYGFSGLTPSVRDSYPWVVDAIYYPATSTGYWLNDSDSYSSYGMLAKVKEERNMSFSASSLNDMGSVSPGAITRSETYNYPLTPDYSLTDAPTYTTMTDRWTPDGSTTMTEALTGYEVHENDNPRRTIITLPNGTKSKQLSFNYSSLPETDPLKALDGLVYHDETYVTANNILQSSNSYWEQGAYNTPRPTRVEKTDERNQTTAAEFSYGTSYNQVIEVRDYDYGYVSGGAGNVMLRSTRTTYQNSTTYTGSCSQDGCSGRHIFNLPLTVEIFDPNNNRLSRTEYQYDGQTLTNTPGVVMHDEANNPYADTYTDCCDWESCANWCQVSPYNPATDYRGNVTQVTSYANAINLTGAVTETRRYDITGNMVTASTSCCQQTSFNYTVDTQYAYPESKTRGSATDAYAQVTTSATYDFYTGLGLSAMDANGRQSTTSYDANTLRPTTSTSPTGAHTDFAYDDVAMTVTSTTYLTAGTGGAIADQNVKYLNGAGQVRIEKARGPDSGGNQTWDEVDTIYNNLGQVYQQSRPYRVGVESPVTSTVTYDSLGRTVSVSAPDGSVTQTFYNEAARPSAASNSPGDTTRVQDAWGRARWGRTDSSGRLVEVVEPDPQGGGSVAGNGLVTTYAHNTLGNLTTINQGAQTRSFKYDSLGRLTAQKLAEQSATLSDAGTYVGSGTWSDFFTYDDRSNLTSRTDARGVKTVYTYNSDPLNRLQSVSWDTTGFGDTGNPILAAATVSYSYRTKASPSDLKDVTQLSSVTAAGVSTEDYAFDGEGRVSSKTLTLASRSGYPFVTDYIYDSLDRATDVRYPAEYGNGSAPRKVVSHTYDIASRLTQLTVDGQAHASGVVYNAASQTTSLSVGTGTNQVSESYSYNAQTGLLDNQTATRNGTTLLNLSYDYAGANGKRTGQLAKVSNNLDHNKDRGYEYDALGRLQRATGGQNVNWVQRYEYDRYGNRNNVFSWTAEQYVKNFYQSALNRQPNSTELQSALSSLQSAYAQGPSQFLTAMQGIGESLFSSQEYANRNRSNHDYVYDLYKAYLYRDPDLGGWAAWEGALINGSSRADVRNGFAWSAEFQLKVKGISPYPQTNGAVPPDGVGLGFDSTSNRINSPGFAYDAAGNQTRALIPGSSTNSQRFQYDAANRLVKVKNDSGTTIAIYTYGDSNERLISQSGDENSNYRTYYAGESGSVTAEYTETPSSPTVPQWSKSYVYLGGRLLSTLTPNGSGGEAVEYDHPDRLGTRLVTNPSSGTSFEQITLPFGTALSAESTGATNRRFTSYDRSATTGLDYAVNRHYDPQQGRFTQVDPIGMKSTSLSSPQTLNLYPYCANDPINHTDPSGLGFFSWLGKLFKGIGKVLSAVGNAVARVLNNRWVRIGVFILGFLLPGIQLLSAALAKVIAFGLKIYNYAADIASQLQLWGSALQGKWKEFGLSIAVGVAGAALSAIIDPIVSGVQDALFHGGNILKGAWQGLLKGYDKFAENFSRSLKDIFIPFYGVFGGPGNPKDEKEVYDPDVHGYDGTDERYKTHDQAYRDPLKNRRSIRDADWDLVKGLVISAPRLHLLDVAFAGRFGGRPGIGSVYKFFALTFFSGSAGVRSIDLKVRK